MAVVRKLTLSCPRTLMQMPPSNMGWQSIAVMMCAIFWNVSDAIFSIILAAP